MFAVCIEIFARLEQLRILGCDRYLGCQSPAVLPVELESLAKMYRAAARILDTFGFQRTRGKLAVFPSHTR